MEHPAKAVHRHSRLLYGMSGEKGGAMQISLTDRLDGYVRAKVAPGLYESASDVIREALRLRIEADTSHEARLQRLYGATDPAWRQVGNGECVPLDLDESDRKTGLRA